MAVLLLGGSGTKDQATNGTSLMKGDITTSTPRLKVNENTSSRSKIDIVAKKGDQLLQAMVPLFSLILMLLVTLVFFVIRDSWNILKNYSLHSDMNTTSRALSE